MDYSKIVQDLMEHGWTQMRLAAVCGCGQATISEIRTGVQKDPRDSIARKLRALHELRGQVGQQK